MCSGVPWPSLYCKVTIEILGYVSFCFVCMLWLVLWCLTTVSQCLMIMWWHIWLFLSTSWSSPYSKLLRKMLGVCFLLIWVHFSAVSLFWIISRYWGFVSSCFGCILQPSHSVYQPSNDVSLHNLVLYMSKIHFFLKIKGYSKYRTISCCYILSTLNSYIPCFLQFSQNGSLCTGRKVWPKLLLHPHPLLKETQQGIYPVKGLLKQTSMIN